MRKRRIYAIQIILSLAIVIGLVTSCAVPSATSPPSAIPTPPTSKYPADISGRVTIAEKVRAATAIAVAPNKENHVFWIVDVSVKNVAYSEAVVVSPELGYKGWEIVAGNEVYMPRLSGTPERASIALGQTGQFMLHFSIPKTLQISDAQICYQGQEPYSYGKLTGGDRVVAYDWDLKKAVTVPVAKEVGKVERIYAVYWFIGDCYKLVVEIKPKSSAVAGKDYLVELYEKGKLRATGRISWNQPELNVLTVKEIYFPLTREEGEAYAPSPFTAPPLDDIFSAKVLER